MKTKKARQAAPRFEKDQACLFDAPKQEYLSLSAQLKQRRSMTLAELRRRRHNAYRAGHRAEERLASAMLNYPEVGWHVTDLFMADYIQREDWSDQFLCEIVLAYKSLLVEPSWDLANDVVTVDVVIRQFRRNRVLMLDGGARLRELASRRVHGLKTKKAAQETLGQMRHARSIRHYFEEIAKAKQTQKYGTLRRVETIDEEFFRVTPIAFDFINLDIVPRFGTG